MKTRRCILTPSLSGLAPMSTSNVDLMEDCLQWSYESNENKKTTAMAYSWILSTSECWIEPENFRTDR